MAKKLWSGGNVAKARRIMAQKFLLGPVYCHLCGTEVEAEPSNGWVVEHKTPIALGGEVLAPDNWAISHRTCSDKSGAGVAAQKRGFSREADPLGAPAAHIPHTKLPSDLLGNPIPRLYTKPLRDLSLPEHSAGHECIEWVESNLGITLLDWQKWFLIHALELNPDGTFRFRTILLLVSRQNGKTTVIECLTAWLMATREGTQILGTSTAQELAREPWSRVADHMEALGLATRITRGSIDTSIHTSNGSRYKVAAATRRGGRSLSIDLLVLDELREMLDDWEAYEALSGTTTARPSAITLALSNAGDGRSVVLNGLRESALANTDETLAIFEWSAPEDTSTDDPEATAQANPALGTTITTRVLDSKRNQLPEAGYRTEHLCQRVASTAPGDVLISDTDWELITTSKPEGIPTAAAIEADFTDGLSLALVYGTTVHVTEHDSLSDAVFALTHSGFTGTLNVGASLEKDPALRGLRIKARAGRAVAATFDLSRLIRERSFEHTGSPVLTEQVLAVRTAQGTDGPRLVSRSRTDAIKATVWALSAARTPRKSAFAMSL